MNQTPRHVAIIMDGNGRWARERGLPRAAGHKAGVEAVREAVKASIELGVPVLTLYAFSQENWKRPKQEVSLLMNLLEIFLKKEVKNLKKEGVKLRIIGRMSDLPPHIVEKLKEATDYTADGLKLTLNLAINYGARQEILDAVRQIVAAAAQNPALARGEGIDERFFSSQLYTHDLPDPDLLIRTSGEMRLSNFLLWQLSYAEIYIAKTYWPDFRKADYVKAVKEYSRRERRFGDVEA